METRKNDRSEVDGRNGVGTSTSRQAQLSQIGASELKNLLYQMILIRRFEEKAAEMYTRAKMGGYLHLNIGEEATVVGALSVLGPEDYIFSNYREHGHALVRGLDPSAIMAELYGKATGVVGGRGGSMHLFDLERHFMGGYAIVGAPLPLAVGAGIAINYRDKDAVVMAMFGDGTTNIGAFHESLNLAKLWGLPVIFLCVNNQYGMGTAVARASAVKEIYKKACAYDMHSVRVDGMDLLSVRAAAEDALRRGREEKEPSFIESVTYRFRGHSMADPARYRTREEVAEWRKRDPIANFEEELMHAGVITENDVADIEKRVDSVIQEAVRFAEESPAPNPADLYKNVYAGEEGR